MNNVRRLVPGWFATMIAASAAICVIGLSQPQPAPAPADAPACTCPAAQTSDNSDAQLDTENAKDLYDTLWLDRYPEMASDTFHAYSYTSDNVGIFMDFHSAYKLTLELFEFKASNSQITFSFPHDSRRAQVSYKIEKLKKPTKYFDVQLTVNDDPSNGGKSTVYFSGPNFRSLHNLPTPLAERLEAAGVMDRLER